MLLAILLGGPSPDKSTYRNVAFGANGTDSHIPRTPFLRAWELFRTDLISFDFVLDLAAREYEGLRVAQIE